MGLGLILAVLNDAANLLLRDERALDPHRLVRSHGQEESITLTHQFLGARLIQDDPRVGEAEVVNASRDGTLALMSPVTTSTLGRWVAKTR